MGFDIEVKQIIISDIVDNTFCATLHACEKSIGVKRLEVIPFSTMCIDCKRKQELGLDLET